MSDLGPERAASELSELTPEMVLPLVPSELAQKHDSNTLRDYAIGEYSKAEGLRLQVAELRAQIDEVTSKIDDAEMRRSQYLEAAEIARAIEDGK